MQTKFSSSCLISVKVKVWKVDVFLYEAIIFFQKRFFRALIFNTSKKIISVNHMDQQIKSDITKIWSIVHIYTVCLILSHNMKNRRVFTFINYSWPTHIWSFFETVKITNHVLFKSIKFPWLKVVYRTMYHWCTHFDKVSRSRTTMNFV